MSTWKDRLQVHLTTLHVSVGKTSQKLHKYRYLYTAPAKWRWKKSFKDWIKCLLFYIQLLLILRKHRFREEDSWAGTHLGSDLKPRDIAIPHISHHTTERNKWNNTRTIHRFHSPDEIIKSDAHFTMFFDKKVLISWNVGTKTKGKPLVQPDWSRYLQPRLVAY